MKKFLSLLLIFATVLAVCPFAVFSSVEETLPQDTSGSTLPKDVPLSNGAVYTKYDALYVGANGEKTANGGNLIGLYTALGTDFSALTLSSTGGLWKNKADVSGQTDAVLRDTYADLDWQLGTAGGVGYHMTVAQWKAGGDFMGVTLPDLWADLADFAVEQVVSQDALSSSSTLSKFVHAVRLDLLISTWLPSIDTSGANERYGYRWTTGSEITFKQTIWKVGGNDFGLDTNLRDAYDANGNQPLVTNILLSKNTGTTYVSYGVAYDNGNSYTKNAYTLSEYATAKATATSATSNQPIFSLFNGVPGDIYAIRVYDAALTEVERTHNRFVDLAAHHSLELSSYMALKETERAVLEEMMLADFTFDSDSLTVQKNLEGYCLAAKTEASGQGNLYVQDGLTYFLAAYGNYYTGLSYADGAYYWKDACGNEGTELRGANWTAGENGGFTYLCDKSEVRGFQNGTDFGLYLPASALPDESYTVEWVYNPVGITVENMDGTLERYIDAVTSTGTYNTMGIAIGPLRALLFSCYRPKGSDGQMEKRWYYNATGDISDVGWKSLYGDRSWQNLKMTDTVTYAVTHSLADGESTYRLYNRNGALSNFTVGAESYKTTEEAGYMFQLMVGLAGTAYSVRVYDRVLTDAERNQNYAADVIYYYGLDTSLLSCLIETGADISAVYTAFGTIGFNLTKEEAQVQMDNLLASYFVAYNGLGVHINGKISTRFYFDVDGDAYAAFVAKGYSIEIGAMAQVGANVLPVFGDENNDMIYAYQNGVKTAFVDANGGFCVTVLYEESSRVTALTPVQVRGFVRIVTPEGREYVCYTDMTKNGLSPDSLFSVNYMMKDTENVLANESAKLQIENDLNRWFEKRVVHLKAGAAAGGDGSIGKPYSSFDTAWTVCKEILGMTGAPLELTLLVGDGEYGIYNTATMNAEDISYQHAYFTVAAEGENAIFTTTKDLASGGFTETADNVWVYQFAKDESGSYPAFRTLYVDGKMADVAYSAGRHAADADTYASKYSYDFDGILQRAQDMLSAGTLTMDTVSPYPAARTDLAAIFTTYKVALLALKEAREMLAAKTLTAESVSLLYPEDAAYATQFEKYRDLVLAAEDPETVTVAFVEDPAATGKLYFDINLVGDYRDEIAAALTAGGNRRTALRYLNVEMHLAGQWWYNIVHLSGIDYDDTVTYSDGTVHVACYRDKVEGYHQQGTMANRYVCFRNAYQYLNTENEYFYDIDDGKLYYYTEGDANALRIARGTSDYMFILEGVRNLTFDGVTFTGTDDYFLSENGAAMNLYGTESRWAGQPARRSAICLYNCYGLTVKNCIFTELACKGIYGEGRVENVTVEDSHFERIAANALYFGMHNSVYDRYSNSNENIEVIGNYMTAIGLEYHNAAAMHISNIQNSRVMYNTVHDCAYTAISLGDLYAPVDAFMAGEAYNTYNLEVAYNYITDFMTELGDGGAFYLAGNNSKTTDTDYYNYVHDNYIVMSNRTGSGLGWMVVGIYFDASSSNWHCYDNVIAAQSYGAVAGENDALYDANDKYTVELRRRRANSTYIYIQHITNQLAHNNLYENNYILNIRSTTAAAQKFEVYNNWVVESRNIIEKNTHYVCGISYIPVAAQIIARTAGCFGHKGDPSLLLNNDY